MEQIKFETALKAAHRDGYEQGFCDRDHSCDRDAGGSWARWCEADGEKIVRLVAGAVLNDPDRSDRLMNEDARVAKALNKLRVAMVPLRSAHTNEARADALNRVHGMLFMLKSIQLVDESTLQVLLGEIRDADRAGTHRCQERSASGEVRRCMQGDVIHQRALALMSLQEALQNVQQAPNRPALDSCCIEFEKQLMDAFPAYVDEDEVVEWRVYIEAAKSKRLEELA